MTMAEPGVELENEEQDLEEVAETTPDPVQEHFDRLEAELTDLKGRHRSTANFVGGLGRQVEELLQRPQTPARDERVDYLMQQMEDIAVREMDSDEKVEYAIKKQRERPEPRQQPQAQMPPPVNTGQVAEQTLMKDTYVNAVIPEWADYAEEKGMPYQVFEKFFYEKLDPRVASADLRFGDPTTRDPLGQRPFVVAGKKLIDEAAIVYKNQQKPPTQIDTERGAGAGSRSKKVLIQQYADGEIPFSPEVAKALG
jgi:hypothetical protein